MLIKFFFLEEIFFLTLHHRQYTNFTPLNFADTEHRLLQYEKKGETLRPLPFFYQLFQLIILLGDY
jgi:hypothetical protein